MFIIENGVGYKLVDDKAYQIDFDENENIIVTDKEIELKGDEKVYSYSEIYRKLNIKYFANLKRTAPKKASNKEEDIKEPAKKEFKKSKK